MDFKIEVTAKKVTRRDIDELVEYLNDQGESFDINLGDYQVIVWQRENENSQWFYEYDDDDVIGGDRR